MTDKTYIVKITAQAQEQLQAIDGYIASELKAPDAARHLLDEIDDSISSTGCIDRGGTVAKYRHP